MADDHAELPPVDRVAFAERYGPRALVAGGASGMGAEYCRQIAAMGIDLVILDRDQSALHATARELKSAPDAVDVVAAVVDLGQPAERLLDVLRRTVGDLEIGLLVANAAWSPVGPFLDSDVAALLAAIDINCRAPVVLIHELGARMAGRGRGGIIVMSSLAAETGTANVALYSATKAFDLVLAEGLWYELRDRGVDVIAIRPGSTRTPGWQSTQPASGELRGVMEPGDVVRDALAALGTTPSIAAGSANRAAEARFRSMARRDVIELMSGITSRLVPPGVSVDDIPVAHTPPGGYGDSFPAPILAGCSDPLVDGAPDLRGLWRVVEVYAGDDVVRDHPALGHVQRIEQCGDRLVVTGGGIIHDMRCDGTTERGVHDVAEFDKTTEITVVATYESGMHVLRPVGLPIEVTRRRDGADMIWDYLGFRARLQRFSEG